MKKHICYLLLAFFTLLPSAFGFAQKKKDSIDLRKNLDSALLSFQQKDSLFLSSDFKLEIKNSYAKEIASYKPELLKPAIKKSILYYSQPNGMEQVIREYVFNTSGNAAEVFTLEDLLSHHIHFMVPKELPSEPQDSLVMAVPMIRMTSVPNKYATLVVKMQGMAANAMLFLNGKSICLLSAAKNGIRVHSNKLYAVEIRSGSRKICSKQVTFARQEKREINCSL